MTLNLLIVILLRMQCLALPLYGVHLMVEERLQAMGNPEAHSGLGFVIPILTCVLAVAFWRISPWLASFILGHRDSVVALTGLRLEDLYRFAFVFLGLYFALSSLAPTLTWAHYTLAQAATSAGRTVVEQRSPYGLLSPAITLAAALACIFKGPEWARKLAQKEKSTEGAAPNGGPATPVGNSGVTEGPPSVS
jgi:hypothetical protein